MSAESRISIKFTFDYYSRSDIWGRFEASREAGGSDSIRALAISVINEALTHDCDIWTSNKVGDDAHISVYLASDTITDVGSGRNMSGFGLKYALRADGSLLVLWGLTPLRHDWTVGEIHELVDLQYISGDPEHVIIGLPEGLGAPGGLTADWVGFLASILTLGDYGLRGAKSVKNHIAEKQIRTVAKTWVVNGIRYPDELREFIDSKSNWTLSEVKLRLKLNEEFAYKLLTGLGLEPKGDVWRLTHSKQSVAKRRAWLRNEKKYSSV